MLRLSLLVLTCLFAPVASAQVNPVSQEPFYADLIRRAEALKAQTEAFADAPKPGLIGDPVFEAYAREIGLLAERNLRAHDDLKARGTDNDLKCVLKGVAVDLPLRLEAIRDATGEQALKESLEDMAYLLEDNIEVIRTPATAESGLDCVLEFGPAV